MASAIERSRLTSRVLQKRASQRRPPQDCMDDAWKDLGKLLEGWIGGCLKRGERVARLIGRILWGLRLGI